MLGGIILPGLLQAQVAGAAVGRTHARRWQDRGVVEVAVSSQGQPGLFPEPTRLFTCTPSKLVAFEGVREFPVRVKCATLAWHTLKAALDRAAGAAPVSTE